MKKYILYFVFMLSSISGIAQDALGYYYFKKKAKEGMVTFVATPAKSITYEKGAELYAPFFSYSMTYVSLVSEDKGSILDERYTLNFVLTCSNNVSVQKGGRLLLKYQNGETLTLKTDKEFPGEYIDGYYLVSPEYRVSKEDIDSIIQKGVIKLRFETLFNNIDLEPNKKDFVVHTVDFIKGIEKRKNNTEDTFNSDF